MTYFKEFRLNWTNLLGAALGLGFGSAINHYMLNLFGPAMINEFGWSKAQFALVGSLSLITMFFTPIAGRITDRYGARTAAMIGFSVVPLTYLAFSFMSGSIYQFYAILMIKNTLGVLTATMVFTRVVVERFEVARGLALSILLSCPALVGASVAPIIGSIIEAEGWRTGYQVLALMSACGGILAIALIGRSKSAIAVRERVKKMDWAHFRELFRNRVFRLLLAGMFLCNLPQILVSSQINILLMDSGATMQFATALVSAYALSVVVGRFLAGYALDRIAPHLVAITALGMPAIGYVMLASDFDARWILAGSIALIGLAQGAETDVGAFLSSRRFAIEHYSFVFSWLMLSMAFASALGSLLLGYVLHMTNSFDIFLYVSAAATVGGAWCFYQTGRRGEAEAVA